eukprot:SAG31_NODE_2400_length_5775_cov_2.602185_1_plen_39_part_00
MRLIGNRYMYLYWAGVRVEFEVAICCFSSVVPRSGGRP